MSEESEGKRGFLIDVVVFFGIIILGLTAIYLSGNWDWFMTQLANLDVEARKIFKQLQESAEVVSNIGSSVQQL